MYDVYVKKKKYSALFGQVLWILTKKIRWFVINFLNLSIIPLFNMNLEYYYSLSINTNILFLYLINKTIYRCILLFISNFLFFFFFLLIFWQMKHVENIRWSFYFRATWKKNCKYKYNNKNSIYMKQIAIIF